MLTPSKKFALRIAGEAGQGIMSCAVILAQALNKGGFYVFSSSEYPSLIRGGHNFVTLTVANKKVTAPKEKLDLILAFNLEGAERHYPDLKKEGIILIDTDQKINTQKYTQRIIELPFSEITREKGGLPVMENMAYLGALFSLLNYPFHYLQQTIEDLFKEKKRKKKEIIQLNQKIAQAGFDTLQKKKKTLSLIGPPLLKIRKPTLKKLKLLNGNEALAQGLIAGGLNFYSAYPMTPASDILHCLAKKGPKKKITVIQPEDEIAGINMALGASYAGARSATATSGGGFCLMTEALGFAGCAEIPVVVINCQRPGPSTGLPTRTEQGDLLFSLSASQGEFPRVVIAPGDVEECFLYSQYALNLAQVYQLPVIILSDKYLASSYETVHSTKLIKIPLKQGKLISNKLLSQKASPSDYKRYQFTKDHISPRILPGQKIEPFTTSSNEHNERGEISEDRENRIKMMQKRMGKFKTLIEKEDMKFYKLYPAKEKEVLLLGWGSTKGVILEARERLKREGRGVGFLQMLILEPVLWVKIKKIIAEYKQVIVIENNYSGQLADFIQQRLGIQLKDRLLKYDGRPFSREKIISFIKKEACFEQTP